MKIDRKKLDLARAKKMVTVKEIVKETGVNYSTLAKDDISPIPLGKVARFLGVEVEELLKEE